MKRTGILAGAVLLVAGFNSAAATIGGENKTEVAEEKILILKVATESDKEAEAQYQLGMDQLTKAITTKGKDRQVNAEQAARLLLKSAKQGHFNACFAIGGIAKAFEDYLPRDLAKEAQEFAYGWDKKVKELDSRKAAANLKNSG